MWPGTRAVPGESALCWPHAEKHGPARLGRAAGHCLQCCQPGEALGKKSPFPQQPLELSGPLGAALVMLLYHATQ